MNKYNKIVFVNGSAPALNADNLNHMDEGIERATDGAIALETEIATARGGQNSLGARLDTTDANLVKKANKSDVDSINSRLQSAEQNLHSKANATDVANALKAKEDNSNKVISKTDITDSNTNYPSIEYLNEYYYDANKLYSSKETDEFLRNKADVNSVYSKVETDDSLGKKADKADVDTSLANKADLVNSSNIFDFNKWAGGLQNLTKSVFRGTLDEVDFAKKTIKFTATGSNAYTNGWSNSPAEMIIAVKPKTAYTFSWHFEGGEKTRIYLFFNGENTDETRLTNGGKAGYLTFTTLEDTSFITIRFDALSAGTTVTVSKIMIEEGNKSLLYIPHAVAEGVNELAQSTNTALSKVNNTLDLKYDSANIESGTSMLTPYSTVTDKIKSASCAYKTIGDIVIVSATVKMNAATIGANSTYPLIDLPYKCIAEDNVFCVGISNLGKVFKFAVLKNNTWLQFQTQDKTAYTFADGEQINVICSYKIK